MKIVVLGCGALGTVLASALSAAGHSVVVACADPVRARQILAEGLRITVHGGEATARPAAVLLLAEQRRLHGDAAIVTLPAWVAEKALPMVEAEVVLVPQPSLRALEWGRPLAFYGCAWGASPASYVAAELRTSGEGEIVDALRAASSVLGIRFYLHGDARSLVWDYMGVNAAAQPAAAVLGVSYGKLSATRHGRALVEAVAEEAWQVASEAGVKLWRGSREAVQVLLGLRGCYPKMLRDLEEGRATEIDYINGALLREALRYGIYTPYNDALYLAVKGLEEVMGVGGGN